MLDDLLQYRSQPQPDGFVAGVMRAIERQQVVRRRILLLCGLVGAAFGVLGASLMSDALVNITTQVFSAQNPIITGSVILMLLASVAWLLYEEPGLAL